MKSFILSQILSVLICIVLLPTVSLAQSSVEVQKDDQKTQNKPHLCSLFFRRVLENIVLVKNLSSIDTRTESALISFTIPQNKAPSFLVNALLSYNIAFNNTIQNKLLPYIEYNQNTLIAKNQNQLAAGLKYEHAITKNHYHSYMSLDGNYTNDYIKQVKGAQVVFLYTAGIDFDNRKCKDLWKPDADIKIGQYSTLGYTPTVGLEYANKDTPNIDLKGNVLRGLYKISVRFNTLPDKIDNPTMHKINIVMNSEYRQEFYNTTGAGAMNSYYTQVSCDYLIFEQKDIGKTSIGIEYVNGANPNKGLDFQSYWNFSLKLKL